jgi:hypothetical protein
MDRGLSSAGSDPGRLPGSTLGPMTLSMTLPSDAAVGSDVARLVAGGVLDRDGLAALIHLAQISVRRGCRELVLDVHGLTDFPSALFAELHKLGDLATRSRCRLRLEGLDTAIAAAVAAAAAVCRGEDAPPGEASR